MAVRDISRNMDKFASKADRQISRANNFVGESFVSNARESVGKSIYGRQVYDKQGNPRQRYPWELSGNLLASIGFRMIENKRELAESFGQGEGASKGKEAAKELSSRIDGFGLVMVAGMEYAAAVESKGFDVISNSVNKAKAQHQRLIKQGLSSLAK